MRKDERQDIYRSSEDKAPQPAFHTDPGAVGQGRRRMARAWRMSLLVILLMGLLLWGAIWIANRTIERGVLDESMFQTGPGSPMTTLPSPTNRPANDARMPGLAIADPFDTLNRLEDQPTFEQVRQDPEKLSAAMEHVRIARRYAANKEWDKAETYLRKALTEWPDMSLAQRLLGVVLTQTGQFDKAMAVLLHALKNDPFSPDAYSNLAAVYMHKGMHEEAEEMLQTALKLDPAFIAANVNLGLLYLVTARYNWAADYLEQGVRQYPENEHTRNNLSVALLRIGRYEEARSHLNILIRQKPGIAHAYFNMAITYALEHDFDNAMVWIRRGAEYCSPISFHHFVSDSDFVEMRAFPPFQQLLQTVYGEMPEPPRSDT